MILSKLFSSKLAANFSQARLLLKPSQPEPTHPSAAVSASTPRPSSHDSESGSSSDSWSRSTTPRPSQSLITVSLVPDDLSEYKDLFTRPPPRNSHVTPSPTPPPNSRLPKSDPPTYLRQGQTPASTISAARRQATRDGDQQSPSRSSRYSTGRKNSDSNKGLEETPGPSVTQKSPGVTPDGEKGLPLSLQRQLEPSIRSRMKLPSNSIRSRPPLMPLLQTPIPRTPLPEVPPVVALQQTSNTKLQATSVQN